MAEGVHSAKIHHRLAAVFKDDCLSCSHVFEWCARFRDGRQSVGDDVCIGAPSTAVTADNINGVENSILEDRCMTVQIVVELSLSVGDAGDAH